MTSESSHKETEIQNTGVIYFFSKGLPGFEHLKEFSLQQHNDIFSILSAVNEPAVTFITVNPFDFITDYEFVLPDDAIQDIKIENREQIIVQCIVTWNNDREKTTVNLLAPLIFNADAQKGKQVILQNTVYTTKHLLWEESVATHKGGEF
jgi:flagellar assembly factor FliW